MNAWQAFAQSAAANALSATLAGIAVVAFLWACLRIAGRPTSRTRFTLWFAALLGIAALPLLVSRNVHSAPAIALPSSWAVYAVALWAVGASIGVLRLASGLLRLRSLRASAIEIDPNTLPACTAAKLTFSGARTIRLYRSDEVSVPMAVGFFRPAVLLPGRLVPQLSAEELDVIVLHETAHMRRFDDWTNLLQKLVKVLLFFHPAVWWIDNRLSLEREMACDEMVLAQAPSAKAYARFLVSFHEKLQSAGAPALVQALISRVSQLSSRVSGILDSARGNRTRRVPVIAAATVLLATLGASPLLPNFVSFGAPATIAASHSNAPLRLAVAREPLLEATRGKVVPASFHPAAATKPVVPRRATAPKARSIAAVPPQPSSPARLVVYHSAQFDGLNWTICVWSVDPTTHTTVEAIVLKI